MISVAINYNPRLSAEEQRLLALPNRLRNLRAFMINDVAPRANAMLRKHWESKGAAFGHRWAPWAPSTRRARLRKGNAWKGLLRDTDHLYTTLLQRRVTDDRLKVIKGGLRLQLNTKVPYAIYHQVGTRFMPERQIIPSPLPPSFTRGVRGDLHTFLLTGRTRA